MVGDWIPCPTNREGPPQYYCQRLDLSLSAASNVAVFFFSNNELYRGPSTSTSPLKTARLATSVEVSTRKWASVIEREFLAREIQVEIVLPSQFT